MTRYLETNVFNCVLRLIHQNSHASTVTICYLVVIHENNKNNFGAVTYIFRVCLRDPSEIKQVGRSGSADLHHIYVAYRSYQLVTMATFFVD